MTDEEIKDVWRIVAGVLTFGQLEFADGAGNDHQASLTNDAEAQKVAALFGINDAALTKCLTKPRIKAGTEVVQKAQSKEQVRLTLLLLTVHDSPILYITISCSHSHSLSLTLSYNLE